MFFLLGIVLGYFEVGVIVIFILEVMELRYREGMMELGFKVRYSIF